MGMKYLIRCRPLYQEIDAFLEGEMAPWNRLLAHMHLAMCRNCRIYLRQYEQVRELSLKVNPAQLPTDFVRVMGQVFGRWKDQRTDSAEA